METIGFIGSGNMAEALIKGVITAKVYEPQNVLISDIRKEHLDFISEKYRVTICKNNQELAAKAETLVLSVKPQNMNDVLENIKDSIG